MPIHDWTKVEAGIFHHFHGEWIRTIGHALNDGLLPPTYYALAEQVAAGVGPDILALEDKTDDEMHDSNGGGTGLLVAQPKARIVEETGPEFYRRKQRVISVRHVTDDRVVAVIEIVSPGNKNNKNGIRSFLDKVSELLKKKIHLLVIDLHPPGKNDPHGIHAAIWDDVWQAPTEPPAEKPLTVASYECTDQVVAYVEPIAVGDSLPDAPLFLVPGGHVLVPLEKTYQTAWEGVPRRWRNVIEPVSGLD